MGVIKGVLKEELKNSLRMKRGYESAIKKLPKGSIVSKNIKGHRYYYLVSKKNGKMIYKYKGKMAPEEVKKYEDAKKQRTKYTKLLNQVKKQIKFIERSLRGKESN